MLTMKDIAAQVGVSVSSVSLVLNDRDAGRVNRDVALRIRELADAFGYVPNQLARSLKSKQTQTIGLVSDRVATVPFSSAMLAGAQEAAWRRGYVLMLVDTGGDEDLQTTAVQSLMQRNVDGLIVAATYHRTVETPRVPATTPVVLLDGRPETEDASALPAADFVVPDEERGARDAVTHLIEAGHRRIGFCTVSAYPIADALRTRGYMRALADAGLPVDPDLMVTAADAATAHGIAPARELLDRPVDRRPTAVFCFGDQIAVGFYQVARSLGLVVPTDLSIVGFDNQEFVAEALDPGLTTMQLPHRAMGEWAVERILDRIGGSTERGSEPVGLRMHCPLVIRCSVSPPRDPP
ncbi:LacI family DNA-binding transcriptional regulator [Curtobacterium sp. VKM Ac-1376]|uniref:LacI family DNA-binding transcriptional regulator n=1 Tax=Curtobacterium sp. VKM Ac-1376 TaxID=123312 RepID=UPI00188C0C46|nr:LacI family DNA-binding transcriptional regulator [Curtobacterium sp. VKM Ac-1376]MBF4615923.1 LacI family DNA-binding transcriptional regulator [Curtobacterium sp. VKM Ac-1376]